MHLFLTVISSTQLYSLNSKGLAFRRDSRVRHVCHSYRWLLLYFFKIVGEGTWVKMSEVITMSAYGMCLYFSILRLGLKLCFVVVLWTSGAVTITYLLNFGCWRGRWRDELVITRPCRNIFVVWSAIRTLRVETSQIRVILVRSEFLLGVSSNQCRIVRCSLLSDYGDACFSRLDVRGPTGLFNSLECRSIIQVALIHKACHYCWAIVLLQRSRLWAPTLGCL